MKILPFFTCLFLCYLNVFAQSVSIELSIETKALEKNICGKHKLSAISYLNLKYVNNTSDSLYFFKIIDRFRFGTGMIACFGSKREISCLDSIRDHSKDKYKVVFGGGVINSYSEIFDYDADINGEHEGDFINDEIQEIYTYILKETVVNKTFYFEKNPIVPTKDNIKTKWKDDLVFLKPGETYVQSFDLTGFCIIGGNYEFIIDKTKIENFVEISSSWDEVQKRWVYRKDYLPLIVDGYKLFSGEIKTNKVNIAFKGLK